MSKAAVGRVDLPEEVAFFIVTVLARNRVCPAVTAHRCGKASLTRVLESTTSSYAVRCRAAAVYRNYIACRQRRDANPWQNPVEQNSGVLVPSLTIAEWSRC